MTTGFEEKSILITGAASGIGRATAIAFAAAGGQLTLADIDEEGGEQLSRTIEGNGGKTRFVRCDVADPKDVERMVDRCMEAFGRLDCAFNNAGIEGEQAPTGESDQENWDRVLSINLTGVWLCMRREIPAMLEGDGGAIVNMSSVAGLVGFPNLPAYVAAKHGVLGLTRAAALEYATQGLRINAICPGVIRTEMVERVTGGDPEVERSYAEMAPIKRMGTPEEIADAVLWLCSPAAAYVIGHPLVADGGLVAE
jgi:NAD(P)-dependent dehydrogenase (short-subunit alcohol dehydrogenase family)